MNKRLWRFTRLALQAAADNGRGLVDAWRSAAEAAVDGAEATRPLIASRGRAARVGGKRSVGHLDPGAVSFSMIVQSIAEVLPQVCEERSHEQA
jgi:phosphoenolpyruvate---glycerone phosphotransferase subunit DhaL